MFAKIVTLTFGAILLALVLRNPSGDTAAAKAGGTLYGDVVGSFVKAS